MLFRSTNEPWQYYADQNSWNASNNHMNVGIIADNGKILYIDDFQSVFEPDLFLDTYPNVNGFPNYFTGSIATLASNPPTSGIMFSALYYGVAASISQIFYYRALWVTTSTGKLYKLSYPSDSNGNITQTTVSNQVIADTLSYGNLMTDISVVDAEDCQDSVYVKLALDKNLPTNWNGDTLWYGKTPNPSNMLTQGMRIYRGKPSENFVTLTNKFPNGVGLLIPEGYDPNLNYLEIAKKAGLING